MLHSPIDECNCLYVKCFICCPVGLSSGPSPLVFALRTCSQLVQPVSLLVHLEYKEEEELCFTSLCLCMYVQYVCEQLAVISDYFGGCFVSTNTVSIYFNMYIVNLTNPLWEVAVILVLPFFPPFPQV